MSTKLHQYEHQLQNHATCAVQTALRAGCEGKWHLQLTRLIIGLGLGLVQFVDDGVVLVLNHVEFPLLAVVVPDLRSTRVSSLR